MAENCQGGCTSSCVLTCSNLCDNVCKLICQNGCTSRCEVACGSACDTMCIGACRSSNTMFHRLNTYLDKASMRKVTTILSLNGDGIYIYPGLNGKITVHRILENEFSKQLSVALYDRYRHGTTKIYNEENQSDDIPEQYKEYSAYSLEEIQRVLYDALLKAFPEGNNMITVEDIIYLVYHTHELDNLYMDIMNWTWNNTDSMHHNLVKKKNEPAIPRDSE